MHIDESTVAMYGYEGGYDGSVTAYGDGSGGDQGAWEQYYDENGYAYWYNTVSGASQYDTPEGY